MGECTLRYPEFQGNSPLPRSLSPRRSLPLLSAPLGFLATRSAIIVLGTISPRRGALCDRSLAIFQKEERGREDSFGEEADFCRVHAESAR